MTPNDIRAAAKFLKDAAAARTRVDNLPEGLRPKLSLIHI